MTKPGPAPAQAGATRRDADGEAVARRNLPLLIAAQSLGGASPAIIVSLGGLVGQHLSDNAALVTLPISLFQLGQALGAMPMGLLMRRYGRRPTYVLGTGLGMSAGLLAAWAIVQGSFLLFCLGTALSGLYGACVQSYRFAAADEVAPSMRARAISRVMVGGLLAAVIGPQVVIWTRDAYPQAPFAGSFIGQAVLALIAMAVVSRLRVTRATAAVQEGLPARPLARIAAQPRFVLAVFAGVASYGLMSFVMTAAPMAMVDCGHTVGQAALGIQWHVLAMYGPSFFTGRLIARYGHARITALGLALIASAAALSLAGLGLVHFWGGLVLLGLGWNFGFIGATAMVAECYRPAERARAQSLNDMLVFGTVAIASFSSGRLMTGAGWTAVNQVVFPIVGCVLAALAWRAWRERGARASA
ncbi:MAG: MFS transporter [Burkholderiaceae bacterium]